MRPIKVRAAKRAAREKGFTVEVQGHHQFLFYCHDGKRTAVYLKISHGASELRQREIRTNAKVNGMAADDFFGLLECTRDTAWMRAHYEQVLRAHP